jgi:hypothetical protein
VLQIAAGEWRAEAQFRSAGDLGAVGRVNHLARHRNTSQEQANLSYESQYHAVARGLSLNNDIVETSGGEQIIDGGRYILRAKRVAFPERDRFAEIIEIERLHRGELNVRDGLVLKWIHLRRGDCRQERERAQYLREHRLVPGQYRGGGQGGKLIQRFGSISSRSGLITEKLDDWGQVAFLARIILDY